MARVASGETLREICKGDTMPTRQTVRNWLREDKDLFDHYARARDLQLEEWEDEILELIRATPDDTKFNNYSNRLKIMIEAKKWLMSVRKPQAYGNKIDVTSKGDKMQNVNAIQVIIEYPNGTGTGQIGN